MPADFKKAQSAAKGRGGNGAQGVVKKSNTSITEPRCSVCTHKQRKVVDRFLVRGTPYRELERVFGLDRRAISNHDKKHLDIEGAAMRRIVQENIEDADEAIEEGIKGIIRHRLFLETALDNALNGILNGDIQVEPRDAVAIIDKLEKMEERTLDSQISIMKIELAAYIKSMKEIVPQDMWDEIMIRTRSEVDRVTNTVRALGAGK